MIDDLDEFIQFWTLYTEGREFGFKSDDYRVGWHRGQDVPGVVEGSEWLDKTIPVLPGTSFVRRLITEKCGGVEVYRFGTMYVFYCHTVPQGAGKFRLADWNDDPKWRGLWRGPHLHLVFSLWEDAAWNDERTVIDPRPHIAAALDEAKQKRDDMAPISSADVRRISAHGFKTLTTRKFAAAKPLEGGTTFPSFTIGSAFRYLMRYVRATHILALSIDARLAALEARETEK